jgi:hypothetical protein
MTTKEQQTIDRNTNIDVTTEALAFAKPILPAVLHLTLNKKSFDMIKSGVKKEEYRQDKMYWKDRFVKNGYWHSQTCKDFDIICFKNGFAKDALKMKVECKGIRIADLDQVNPDWFGSFQNYEGCRIFIISLGRVLSVSA